jgi:hypothetical protein
MMKLKLLGAAAILSTALATPLMAQEATQEPGMIGLNYPNSDYLRGGYGVRLPNQWERHSFGYYAPPGVLQPWLCWRPGWAGGRSGRRRRRNRAVQPI